MNVEWLEYASSAVSVLVTIASVIFGVLIWRLRGEFVPRSDWTAHCVVVDENLEAHGRSLARLEELTRSLPTSADLNAMRQSSQTLETQVGVLAQVVAGQKDLFLRLEKQVDRMDGYLREVSR